MTDKLYVLNQGQALPTDFTTDPPALTYNTNASVNTRLLTIMGTTSPTATNRSNIEIHSDIATSLGGGTKSFPTGGDYDTPNLFDTPSYRVCIDVNSTAGLEESSGVKFGDSACTRDYFILIHSDDLLKHHFAKITEQVQYEGENYLFDFTPKMDSFVPKNTNVTIYQGPLKTDNVVAVGYGLLNDTASSEERHDRYADVTRPTFYFYEDDKLDPNRKYTALKTFTPTGSPSTMVSVFKTASTSDDFILDKSFYTQNAVIVDSNKTSDETLGSDITVWANNIAKYDNRAGSVPISTYMNFITSPVRNQQISTPVSVNIKNSITNRGNIFEAEYIDPERFLDKKIKDLESVEIKQHIGSDEIAESPPFVLPGVYNNHTDNDKIEVTGLLNGQDLQDLLKSSSNYELIFIDSYYYTITNITAPVDGTQIITIARKRAVTDASFSGTGATVETITNARATRRRWGGFVQNMGVSHEIDTIIDGSNIKRNNTTIEKIEADIYNLEYLVSGTNFGIQLKVDQGDKLNSFTKLQTIPSSIFNSTGNLLDCIRTGLTYNKILMSANVEFKESNVEGGIFRVKISGRDKISQLLGSPVNKNYTYTEEYVYSTLSPYNINYTATTFQFSGGEISGRELPVNADPTSDFSKGDVIYGYNSVGSIKFPLGVVDSTSTGPNKITLMKEPPLTYWSLHGDILDTSVLIYKATPMMLAGKTLEFYNGIRFDTNKRMTGATTLLGSADKGIVFESGKYYTWNSGTPTLLDEKSLPEYSTSNSLNGFPISNLITTVVDADGFNRDMPIGIKLTEQLDTASSIVEFDIINQETVDDRVVYTLGYISPVVAGRVKEKWNIYDEWLDDYPSSTPRIDSFYLINGQGLPEGGFLHLLNNELESTDNSPLTYKNVIVDDGATTTNDFASLYESRFGPAIWRYANKTKGNMTQAFRTVGTDDTDYITRAYANDYYKEGGEFKFYVSGYKAFGDTIQERDVNRDETSAHLKDIPTERLGVRPAIGSRFWDVTRYPTNFTFEKDVLANLSREHFLEHHYEFERWDGRAGSLHLFCPGDFYPESQKNWNNIDYTENSNSAKPLTDYSIIFKNAPKPQWSMAHSNTTDSSWEGVTQHGNRLDQDYDSKIITDSNGSRERFNLVRLTEVTFDEYLNEVDYETYTAKTNSPNSATTNQLEIKELYDVNSTLRGQADADWTTSTNLISADRAYSISTNDYLMTVNSDASSNFNYNLVGKISSWGSSAPHTIQLTSTALVAGNSGENLYVLSLGTNETIDILKTSVLAIPHEIRPVNDIPNQTLFITSDGAFTPTGWKEDDGTTNLNVANHHMVKKPITVDGSGDYFSGDVLGSRFVYESQSFENGAAWANGKYSNFMDDMDLVFIKVGPYPGEYVNTDSLSDYKNSILAATTSHGSVDRLKDSGTDDIKVTIKNAVAYKGLDTVQLNTGLMETDVSTGADYTDSVRTANVLFRPNLTVSDFTVIRSGSYSSTGWGVNKTGSTPKFQDDEAILIFNINDGGGPALVKRHWIHYANNLTGYYLYDDTNSRLHYVKEHTVTKIEAAYRHAIKIDNFNNSTVPTSLRLLKVNQTCFWEYSPKRITLNSLSSEYTRAPGTETMLPSRVANANKTNGGEGVFESSGVRSMYCFISIDGKNTGHLVSRSSSTVTLPSTGQEMYVTDGITKYSTSFDTPTSGVIELGELKHLRGTPSFGTLFTVTTDVSPSFDPQTANIGAAFNVVREAEDVVDDILSSIGLTFNKSTIGKDYYLSANFTGQNAYVAANSALDYKNKKLLVNGNDITIVANEEDRFYRNIEISEDNNEYKIVNIKRDKSLFDQFNSIVVFGDGIKSTAKSYRQIKNTGREVTKEVYDFTIINQKQADEKARRLLKIHSSVNDAIEIEIGDSVPYLSPGQIISVYYPSEGIFRAPFIVLEIERQFGRPIKVRLGEYNRDLANTMSLLLSETRNLQGQQKQKVYSNVSTPNVDIQTVRLKFVKAKITNNTVTTSTTIGFGYTIGFDSEVSP